MSNGVTLTPSANSADGTEGVNSESTIPIDRQPEVDGFCNQLSNASTEEEQELMMAELKASDPELAALVSEDLITGGK